MKIATEILVMVFLLYNNVWGIVFQFLKNCLLLFYNLAALSELKITDINILGLLSTDNVMHNHCYENHKFTKPGPGLNVGFVDEVIKRCLFDAKNYVVNLILN